MNIEELKRLAESVINADNSGDAIEAAMEFMKAAGPQEILAIIQQRDEMLAALRKIAEWTERYTTPGHPISTVARAAIANAEKMT